MIDEDSPLQSTMTPVPRLHPPPLESGDHLARDEFERRYQAMPESVRAELIEGVVYVASPVRFTQHGRPHGLVVTWLGVYEAATPGVAIGDNATIRLDLDNEPQPDVVLRVDPRRGGRSADTADGYVEGAPELVAEVAASSASIDLHQKPRAYRRNGVLEYVVWRVLDEELDWFVLEGGRYEPLAADADGVLRSRAFPGLWLDTRALLARELGPVLARLDLGLRTAEHAAFRQRLGTPP